MSTPLNTSVPHVGGVIALQVISFKAEHSLKADLPILVTPSGIVIEVKPVQAEKADSPMLVTPSGIVIEVKPVQPEKAD